MRGLKAYCRRKNIILYMYNTIVFTHNFLGVIVRKVKGESKVRPNIKQLSFFLIRLDT